MCNILGLVGSDIGCCKIVYVPCSFFFLMYFLDLNTQFFSYQYLMFSFLHHIQTILEPLPKNSIIL